MALSAFNLKYVSLLETALKRSAVTEMDEAGVDMSCITELLPAPMDPEAVDVELKRLEAKIKPALSCFFEARQRLAKGLKDESQTMITCMPAAKWSAHWVAKGVDKLATASTEEQKEEIQALHSPFAASCIDDYISWCFTLGMRGLYTQQTQWVTFFLEFIADYLSEARVPLYQTIFRWGHVTSVMSRLGNPEAYMLLKTEPMQLSSASKELDKRGAVVAAQYLLDIYESTTSTDSLVSDPKDFRDKTCIITSALWLVYRYYIPRQLTFSISSIPTPRHAVWTELVDLLLSENVISFLYLTNPELLRYIALFGLLLKRRHDVIACVLNAIRELDCLKEDPLSSIVLALDNGYDQAQVLLKDAQDNIKSDFLLAPLSTEVAGNLRYAIFESYYKLHNCGSIAGLISLLNLDPVDGEKKIVELIKNSNMDATIDSAQGTITVKSPAAYNTTQESTKSVEIRSKFLIKSFEQALRV